MCIRDRGISRSTVYYEPRPISEEDLRLMRRLDELHLNYPFAGSRMLRGLLWQQGLKVGRRHIKTLMKRMGIEAIYRKPNTSKPAPGHRIYPYLLRGLAITRPNPVSYTHLDVYKRQVPHRSVRKTKVCGRIPCSSSQSKHGPKSVPPAANGIEMNGLSSEVHLRLLHVCIEVQDMHPLWPLAFDDRAYLCLE